MNHNPSMIRQERWVPGVQETTYEYVTDTKPHYTLAEENPEARGAQIILSRDA
jgi:hypothetical protein